MAELKEKAAVVYDMVKENLGEELVNELNAAIEAAK